MKQFTNKTAIAVGGTSGIGKAAAELATPRGSNSAHHRKKYG